MLDLKLTLIMALKFTKQEISDLKKNAVADYQALSKFRELISKMNAESIKIGIPNMKDVLGKETEKIGVKCMLQLKSDGIHLGVKCNESGRKYSLPIVIKDKIFDLVVILKYIDNELLKSLKQESDNYIASENMYEKYEKIEDTYIKALRLYNTYLPQFLKKKITVEDE